MVESKGASGVIAAAIEANGTIAPSGRVAKLELGVRTCGHQDPGATSMARRLRAFPAAFDMTTSLALAGTAKAGT